MFLRKKNVICVRSRHCVTTPGNGLHCRGFSGQGLDADRGSATTQPLGCSPAPRRHVGAESCEDTRADTAKAASCFHLPATIWDVGRTARCPVPWSAVDVFILLISNGGSLGKLRKPKRLLITEVPFSQSILSCRSSCS